MTDLNTPRRRRGASLEKRKARAGYLFVLPFLLGVFLIYLPILIDSVWFSFSNLKPVLVGTENVWMVELVGLENYKTAFAQATYPTKLLSAIQELIFQVPAILIFSLFIAVVLNQKMLGRAAFRAIFFVPVIIATGLMESIELQDVMGGSVEGGINDGSGGGGAGTQIISFMDVEKLFANMRVGGELVAVVVGIVNDVYSIINYSGVQMLIFLAGLQSISPSIYEACQIEGATTWETFWKITFPMISPMILVNAVYTIIDAFTKTSNPVMQYLETVKKLGDEVMSAMFWVYFIIIMLIIGLVAAVSSAFVFYQRRD